MATQTTNLRLTKPSYSDAADINVLNANMDIIDEEVAKKANKTHRHNMSEIEGLSLQAKNVTIEDASSYFASGNVEGALSELFQSVSSGKSSIAKAITDKGVPASASDDFNTLANKISQIISELLNIPFPKFDVGIGTVSATFDTLDSTFKEFRIQGQGWQSSNVFNSLKGNTSYTFEAKYGGNRVSNLTIITPKANQAKPSVPRASNIEGDRITVTAPEGCKIRFNGNNFDSPHTFTGLSIKTLYQFYAYKPSTNELNESPLSDVLTVQTLDKVMLFNSKGNYPLNSLSAWRKDSSRGVSFFDIQNGNLKIVSGISTSDNSSMGIVSYNNVDLSRHSKLVFKIARYEQTGYDIWRNYARIGLKHGGTVTTNGSSNLIEIDIKEISSGIPYIYVHAYTSYQTTLEISEIYLTN